MFTIRNPRAWFKRDAALSLDQYADLLDWFTFNGSAYLPQPIQTIQGEKQEMADNFLGYSRGGFKASGVIFACMAVRMSLFSEARFQYRRMQDGRPGDLFGDQSLDLLERPWPNGTTSDLLKRIIQDADLAGNFYATRLNGQIKRLRPDWVSIVLGGESDSIDDAELVGYAYFPGGKGSGRQPIPLLPEEVCHFAPKPDPEANYRGMSWLSPVVTEIMADKAATQHKLRFFENGATSNLAVIYDPNIRKEAFDIWTKAFDAKYGGLANAYRTLHIGGGSDLKTIGTDFKQMEFKVTQGAGETRIAAAAEVPPVIVGLSEGLASATYSNYQLAMRRFADLTMRPLWRDVAGSLATLVDVPGGAELWYDDRDVPALADNAIDRENINSLKAQTSHTLITAGFEPASVIQAVLSGDFSVLQHSGMYSVQLQPAGTVGEGKGSLIQGAPVPEEQALAGQNGSSANP